jgi:hypothetical protein
MFFLNYCVILHQEILRGENFRKIFTSKNFRNFSRKIAEICAIVSKISEVKISGRFPHKICGNFHFEKFAQISENYLRKFAEIFGQIKIFLFCNTVAVCLEQSVKLQQSVSLNRTRLTPLSVRNTSKLRNTSC